MTSAADEATRIRRATPADAEAIVDVHVAAIRELGSAAYDPPQVEAWASNKRPERYPIGAESVAFVVAERGDDIVGFGWAQLKDDEVTAVYVAPDHARSGVGTAILESLEGAARDTGLETLGLTASKNAVGFYERQGYETVEWIDVESRGEILECARMRKRLEGDG